MYRRFLNNGDYLGIITEDSLSQITRGKNDCFPLAEEAAEEAIIEYLSDNYMVEEELEIGKSIIEYDPRISYSPGTHFTKDGKIYKATRYIAGAKSPSTAPCWEEYFGEEEEPTEYNQFKDYVPNDIVLFADKLFMCVEYNGISYERIEVPGVIGWEVVTAGNWEPNVEYMEWDVVLFGDSYYALLDSVDVDLTQNPEESDKWGLIGTYDPTYRYEYNDREYVEYNGNLYLPLMPPSPDELAVGFNMTEHDPRNASIKKHLVRLALYELHKLISPNNVSSARIADYEASIEWLRDANKMRINPKIPRRIAEDNKSVAEFATATYMRDYDPYKNPWQI